MRRATGFTLIELLLALFSMALVAVLGWRGLDGMTRAIAGTDTHADQVLALQVGLAQWNADLDGIAQLPQTVALEWDGRVLRMTRRSVAAGNTDSLHVVAWTERRGHWLRWQSPPLVTRSEVAAAWRQAGLWSHNPGGEQRRHEVAIAPLREWQIYYFRGDSWTHPLSSDDAGTASTAILPDGVRLVLVLPEEQGQAMAGRIVRDWVSPKLGGGKS